MDELEQSGPGIVYSYRLGKLVIVRTEEEVPPHILSSSVQSAIDAHSDVVELLLVGVFRLAYQPKTEKWKPERAIPGEPITRYCISIPNTVTRVEAGSLSGVSELILESPVNKSVNDVLIYANGLYECDFSIRCRDSVPGDMPEYGRIGLLLEECLSCRVMLSDITMSGKAVYLRGRENGLRTTDTQIRGCRFKYCKGQGVGGHTTSGTLIYGCEFGPNPHRKPDYTLGSEAIILHNSTGVRIADCRFVNHGTAISFVSGINNDIAIWDCDFGNNAVYIGSPVKGAALFNASVKNCRWKFREIPDRKKVDALTIIGSDVVIDGCSIDSPLYGIVKEAGYPVVDGIFGSGVSIINCRFDGVSQLWKTGDSSNMGEVRLSTFGRVSIGPGCSCVAEVTAKVGISLNRFCGVARNLCVMDRGAVMGVDGLRLDECFDAAVTVGIVGIGTRGNSSANFPVYIEQSTGCVVTAVLFYSNSLVARSKGAKPLVKSYIAGVNMSNACKLSITHVGFKIEEGKDPVMQVNSKNIAGVVSEYKTEELNPHLAKIVDQLPIP